jgi:hypothetical protein
VLGGYAVIIAFARPIFGLAAGTAFLSAFLVSLLALGKSDPRQRLRITHGMGILLTAASVGSFVYAGTLT